jgi:choline dehydrogenase-like flavoprotein
MNQKAIHPERLTTRKDYDVIVIGSGPGGATVAKELSKAGKSVLLLEKGKDHRNLGTYRGAFAMLDKGGFFKSREGLTLLKATTTGGATTVYSGSAAMPPEWLKTRHGVDLGRYAQEAWKELKVSTLPDHLLGNASRRIMDTANSMGYAWEPSPKILDIRKFKNGKCCGANTSLGCTCGAKWTARDYIREAVEYGTDLLTETECTGIITKNGRAVGVEARCGITSHTFHAGKVVLAAGGIPSPVLLKKAGIDKAGDGCVIDPTVLVYGESPHGGSSADPLVSVVTWEFYESHGIRLGTLIDPWLMTLFNGIKSGVRSGISSMKYRNLVGILVKIKDEPAGWVNREGEVSKALTDADMEKIAMGRGIAEDILRASGCPQKSLFTSPIKGAHPSGTCPIGHVVDLNLETDIRNLFVCDASVFPEALDRPTVITLIALGKRLAAHLTG